MSFVGLLGDVVDLEDEMDVVSERDMPNWITSLKENIKKD